MSMRTSKKYNILKGDCYLKLFMDNFLPDLLFLAGRTLEDCDIDISNSSDI